MTAYGLRPVITRISPDIEPFDLWPVTPFTPDWLPIHGGLAPGEVGEVVRALLFHNLGPGKRRRQPPTPAAALRVLVEHEEELYAPGGLMLSSSAGLQAEPGCCHDLFEWRSWWEVARGRVPDLGHAPCPLVEHRGEVVRVWTSVETDTGEPSGPHVDFPRAELPGMLAGARRDLLAFLGLLRTWADGVAPDLAGPFVAAVDRGLGISAPLPG